MEKIDGESTVEAKQTFERKGIYTQQLFSFIITTMDSQTLIYSILQCLLPEKYVSFYGINAHHLNSEAENRIKDVITGERTSLLHAAHQCPEAIHTMLWPATLKNCTNIRKSLPTEL